MAGLELIFEPKYSINQTVNIPKKIKIRQNEKKNIIINAENSGTLGRLIMGILIDTPHKIKIIGDKSLSKRDFNRIAEPLSKFGAKIKLTKKGLPLTIKGNKELLPIRYLEQKGSAQCKSSIIFAGLKTEGKTFI